jgi:predicted nicotinamide N-methyase
MQSASDLEELATRFSIVATEVSAAGRSWTIRRPASCDDLICEEDFDRDDRLPYWAELWPSARVMADHIGRRQGAGQRLLELGCGVGLVALAAARAGFDVLATDYYSEALEFTLLNSAMNGVSGLATRLIDWRRMPDDLGRFDWIVASDVLYERPNADLVAAAIDRTLAAAGTALVTDPGRRPAEYFPAACEARGLDARLAGTVAGGDGETPVSVRMYEIHRRAPGAYPRTAGDRPDFAESSEQNGTVPFSEAVLG